MIRFLAPFCRYFPVFYAKGIRQLPACRAANRLLEQRVQDLYNRNCARCHGADGRGETPMGDLVNAPDFTDRDWWRKNSRITRTKTLRSIVARGKGEMPAFGRKLTKFEVNLLVNRVRSFRKPERKT